MASLENIPIPASICCKVLDSYTSEDGTKIITNIKIESLTICGVTILLS